MTPHRVEMLADWRRAAVAGYIDGGLTTDAASAIVGAAADGVGPLLRAPLTRAALETFCAALDLEAFAHARRYGAAMFRRQTNGR